MNISYDYYKIFYYVAKCGSFTQAANILINSQPNLTRAIKSLEAGLGCTLLERTTKGVTLTEEGEKLYENISVAIEQITAGEERIIANKSLEKGFVSIGATEIALRCFLLPILNRYCTKYPGVRIKIINVSTPQALTMLKGGLVDLCVLTTPMESSPELTEKTLKEFNEIAVCGETFRSLSEGNALELSELCNYPIVSLGSKTSTYEYYMKYFARNGLSFSADIEAATADQLIPLIKHNLGIGFVPEDFFSETSEAQGIYRIHLANQLPSRAISLVKKKNHAYSLPARELEKMILEK
ncbi:MAG: LysR family transcriptional regulator [Ruminococcaceae bacterium]|nr:LysR family transcriptional regulator [Oscillospiraceae bacterium]